MSSVQELFADLDLSSVFTDLERKMHDEIEAFKPEYLLNVNPEELCDALEQKYSRRPPRLLEQHITAETREVQIQLDDRMTRGRPGPVSAIEVRVTVPFEGQADLFKYRPSSWANNWPSAVVEGNKLVFVYHSVNRDAKALKAQQQSELALTKRYLEWVQQDAVQFNSSVRAKAKARIEARRNRLLDDLRFAKDLGFPLKRRPNAPKTYAVPSVRRKPPVALPPAGAPAVEPEPVLDTVNYEHILRTCSLMARVLEMSPKAFAGMAEEHLRSHFLVQLNAQYEGMATGETFNLSGKTDIIINYRDKHLFIAECKFWDGPKSLTDATDQLLNYTCWRDTKTAILLFNRRKDFSAVLRQIPEVVKAHPNCLRDEAYGAETASRFVLHHRDDKERQLILTVLAFDVPA